MIVNVCDLAGTEILSGSEGGKRLFKELVTLLPNRSEFDAGPTIIFLDFSAVVVATASYLRESVVQFKSFTRATKSAWYPVIANANEIVIDELAVICDAQSDVFLSCQLRHSVSVEAKIIGSLEIKQAEAFDFVNENRKVSAKQFMDATAPNDGRQLSPTAWNNRLNALVDKGVVIELGSNRQKMYSAVLEF